MYDKCFAHGKIVIDATSHRTIHVIGAEISWCNGATSTYVPHQQYHATTLNWNIPKIQKIKKRKKNS